MPRAAFFQNVGKKRVLVQCRPYRNAFIVGCQTEISMLKIFCFPLCRHAALIARGPLNVFYVKICERSSKNLGI